MYATVCRQLTERIAVLRAENRRTVYFTGHSLGGALATVASIDVALSLELQDMFVLTFGSPRCGNASWRRVYDNTVAAHWRVAMRSDVVTAFPKGGYRHVGKQVVLTKSGDMFLDPNAIETVLWSSVGLNLADHGKPAYKASLELFAAKYLPLFEAEYIVHEAEKPEILIK